LGTEKIKTYNETLQFNTLKNYLVEAMSFANREDAWDQNKELFKSTTLERDKARSQDFVKTFPELASMIYE
jgi:hypothetical protein